MRLQSPIFAALLLGLTAVLAVGKSVISGRTALVQEANLTRSVVTLADLLPATASAELRTPV